MDNVKALYEQTELTQQQIAEQCGLTPAQVQYWIANNYTEEFRRERKRACYSNSKVGDKNPMKGKVRENHHGFVGEVSDGKGYIMELRPDWFTGRKGSKHIFKHHIVMCEALGITEIPAGFQVHHIDKDPTNNAINNLALLTLGAHMRLHAIERATTRAFARRVQEGSKRLASVSTDDDIV